MDLTRKTKIVATLGPSCDDDETLAALIAAGMNVARLNFSHGTHAGHAARVERVRRLARAQGLSVGILQDLQGPKIRVGALKAPLHLAVGEQVHLYPEDKRAAARGQGVEIPVDFPELFDAVHPGDRLLLDDGRLSLRVTAAAPDSLDAEVIVGGELSAHKGINLPGVQLRIPAFTAKDADDLAFGLSLGVDAVAISFVRSPDDVQMVRDAIQRLLPPGRTAPLLIAKLERPEALSRLDEILELVDGVMVARGDLGVEMAPEKVPVEQKRIIRLANEKARLVITATQMLESMINNPLPTRAEASDVANAVFDGTDAVMLSAETAAGAYPVESVQMMARIIREAEAHFLDWGEGVPTLRLGESDAASMALAAHELARDRDVSAVAVFTMGGTTGRLMSKVRPRVPILAFTPEESTFWRLAFFWGVHPQWVPFADTLEEMLTQVDAALRQHDLVAAGQQVVLICGFPVGAMRPPNMALLHTVGE